MTPAALAFLASLAFNYAFDLVFGGKFYHKLNIIGAAISGFIALAVMAASRQ